MNLFYLMAVLFGACAGSFANVCIARLPRGLSVVSPRSHCPRCKRKLSWWENIPVVSFLILRGRCRSCKNRISYQYPMVEILGIVFSLLVWWHFKDIGQYFAYYLLFVMPLLIASVIDLHHKIIPDAISLPGIAVGFIVRQLFAHPGLRLSVLLDSLLGVVVGAGFLFIVAYGYEKIKKREGLGGGDVKLAAMFGAFFGWQAVIFILMASSMIGLVGGLFVILVMKKDRYFEIPFGPFLSLAAFLYLLFGEGLIQWYLNLF